MTHSQPDIKAHIQRIEHNLIPSDTFRSLITQRHSIEESMMRYRVPGLSVAVINNGHLEWAKKIK